MENKVEDTEVIHFHLLNCAAINFFTGRTQTAVKLINSCYMKELLRQI